MNGSEGETPIRTALRRNRLSQVMVAEALGVSRQIVWEWCQGRVTPSGSNLAALLRYLRLFEPEIALDDLLPESQLPQHVPDVPQAAAAGGRR